MILNGTAKLRLDKKGISHPKFLFDPQTACDTILLSTHYKGFSGVIREIWIGKDQSTPPYLVPWHTKLCIDVRKGW